MTPFDIEIDDDDPGKYRVVIHFNEGDTIERFGRRAEIIVYVDRAGRAMPDAADEISREALATARKFLQRILDE